MTKTVRIENADTNTSFKVRVRAQHKDPQTGEWADAPEEPVPLDYPTQQAAPYVTSHRRLIVEEY